MNELIMNSKTMSSLEISELTGKRHDNVMRDIANMLNELNLDFLSFEGTYTGKANRTSPCFNLNEELSLTLVSGYSIKMRHLIIKRWQELEKDLIPQSYSAALQLSADLQKKIELDSPKVKFADAITESANTRSIRYWVKAMKHENNLVVGEKAVFNWLRDKGYIFKHENVPYSKYESNGLNYLIMIVSEDYNGKPRRSLHITGHGMLRLTPKILEYFGEDEF